MANTQQSTVEPYKLRGFKGLNNGVQPQNIHDSEFQDLQNFYPFEGVLKRRGGLDRITQTAHSEKVNSLFAYKTASGTWTLIAGTDTKIAKMNSSDALVSITQESESARVLHEGLPHVPRSSPVPTWPRKISRSFRSPLFERRKRFVHEAPGRGLRMVRSSRECTRLVGRRVTSREAIRRRRPSGRR